MNSSTKLRRVVNRVLKSRAFKVSIGLGLPIPSMFWLIQKPGLARAEFKQLVSRARINHLQVLEGDADVYTKSGRLTRVGITTSNLQVHRTGASIVLSYYIEEQGGDQTVLFDSETFYFGTGPGRCIQSLAPGRGHVAVDTNYSGVDVEEHKLHEEYDVSNTYLPKARFKIDGRGSDNDGNAYLNGSLVINVYMEDC